jgi:hypothetical protein
MPRPGGDPRGGRVRGNGIQSHQIEHAGVAGQIEQRLCERAGRNLGKCGDAGPPMPAANSKQRRPVTLRDRRVRSDCLSVMKQLVRDENLLRRCMSEQAHGQAASDGAIKKREPPSVKHDAGRPLSIFGKSPDRADQRIVVGCLDRYPKLARDLMRGEIGETRPQGFGGGRAVGERVANGGEFSSRVEALRVRIGLQHGEGETLGRRCHELGQPGRV